MFSGIRNSYFVANIPYPLISQSSLDKLQSSTSRKALSSHTLLALLWILSQFSLSNKREVTTMQPWLSSEVPNALQVVTQRCDLPPFVKPEEYYPLSWYSVTLANHTGKANAAVTVITSRAHPPLWFPEYSNKPSQSSVRTVLKEAKGIKWLKWLYVLTLRSASLLAPFKYGTTSSNKSIYSHKPGADT